MKRFTSWIIFITLALATEANAATRSIQFSGLVTVESSFQVIGMLNDVFVCSVVVTNTGNTRQIVDQIQFANGGGFTAVGCGNVAPGGAGVSLNSGNYCVGTFRSNVITQELRQGICSGVIWVRDATNDQPGSVVASGSIVAAMESQVMGGILSGSLYASGHLVQAADANRPSGSMNLYCNEACSDAISNLETCQMLCGSSTNPTPYGIFTPRNVSGIVEDNDAVNPTASRTISTATNGNGSFPKQVNVPTPSLFLGGAIYEMNLGSMNSICNGTQGYLGSDGAPAAGDPFSGHSAGEAYPLLQGGKGEILFCGHRHGLPDLISRVGFSSPVVINGGMPF